MMQGACFCCLMEWVRCFWTFYNGGRRGKERMDKPGPFGEAAITISILSALLLTLKTQKLPLPLHFHRVGRGQCRPSLRSPLRRPPRLCLQRTLTQYHFAIQQKWSSDACSLDWGLMLPEAGFAFIYSEAKVEVRHRQRLFLGSLLAHLSIFSGDCSLDFTHWALKWSSSHSQV